MPVPSETVIEWSCPRAAPHSCSRPGRAGGVVVDHHREAEPPAQQLGQPEVDHAGEVRAHPQRAGAVDEPRGAQPDRGHAVPIGLVAEAAGQVDDRVDDRVAAAGGGHPLLEERGSGSLGVDDDPEHLGAAEVEPAGKGQVAA